MMLPAIKMRYVPITTKKTAVMNVVKADIRGLTVIVR